MRRVCFFSLFVFLCSFIALSFTGCSPFGGGNSDNGVAASGNPAQYDAASGINGGKLYDKFWAIETGFSQSSSSLTTFNNYADFFRCKQCHGWDLLGKTGAYIGRAPKTNRPNVAGGLTSMKSLDPQTIFNAIKTGSSVRRAVSADLSTYNPDTNATVGDQMPDYSAILSDAQIWDLVKFLKADSTDVTQLYDITTTGTYPTGTKAFSNLGKGGDATAGKTYFAANCATCHGADGTTFKVDGDSAYVGAHFRSNSHEDQHKVKFGQLGAAMTGFPTISLTEMKNLYAAMSDTTAFPDTVPTTSNGSTLYASKCAACHGALASSTKKGKSATTIQSALTSVGAMSSISLTTTEIQAIATALQ